jgi:hypothetical protein
MANVLIRVVDRYGLRDKVGWFTEIRYFMPSGVTYGIVFIALFTEVSSKPFCRCMEHSVDLSAKNFVQTISPSSQKNSQDEKCLWSCRK